MDTKHKLEPYSFARTPAEPPQPSHTFDFPTKLDNPILTFEHSKQPAVSESRLDEIERAAAKCDLLFLSDEETRAFEKRLKQKYPNSGPFLYSFALNHKDCQPTGRISGVPMDIKFKTTFSTLLSETYELSATWPKIAAKHQLLHQDSKHTEVKKDQAFWRAKFAPCLAEIKKNRQDDEIIAKLVKAALRIEASEIKKDQAFWHAKFNVCLDELSTVNREVDMIDEMTFGRHLKRVRRLLVRIDNRNEWKRSLLNIDGKWPVVKKPDQHYWPDQDVVPDSKEHGWRRTFYRCVSELVKARRKFDRVNYLCAVYWLGSYGKNTSSGLLQIIRGRFHVTFSK
jgi:hypothetical protein